MTDLTPEAVAELHVWCDDCCWYVARDIDDLRAVWCEHNGCQPDDGWFEAEHWERLADDSTIKIVCNEQGQIDDEGESVERTCRAWAAREGRGMLCTTER